MCHVSRLDAKKKQKYFKNSPKKTKKRFLCDHNMCKIWSVTGHASRFMSQSAKSNENNPKLTEKSLKDELNVVTTVENQWAQDGWQGTP